MYSAEFPVLVFNFDTLKEDKRKEEDFLFIKLGYYRYSNTIFFKTEVEYLSAISSASVIYNQVIAKCEDVVFLSTPPKKYYTRWDLSRVKHNDSKGYISITFNNDEFLGYYDILGDLILRKEGRNSDDFEKQNKENEAKNADTKKIKEENNG